MILVKSFIKSIILAGVFAWLVGGTVMSQVNGVQVDPDKLTIDNKPTIIFDKNGDPIFSQYRNEKHYMTSYAQIPREVIEALVSTEDREFFQHSGISVKGIARALVVDFKSGAYDQGGSTITQQLAKQIYLHSGKTLDRKKEEAVVATTLEKMYSKEQIISFYLDHSFFGYNSYGVEDAIQTYFGQSLEEFKKDDRINRIVKAALVAGIPQAPSQYSPYFNPKDTKKRRDIVLANMLEEKYITQDEYDKAIKKDFLVLKTPKIVHDEVVNYPEIVTYVLDEAKKQLNLNTPEEVIKKGVNIYTSFDPSVYKEIRKQFEKNGNFPKDASDKTKVQGAAVFLNPQNGEILALTGGRDEETNILNFNRAFQSFRQPGSSIKPLLDYGPAIEYLGWTPWSLVVGAQGIDFGGGYTVKDHGYASQRMMIDALAHSNNVPAVWTLQQVGISKAKKYAQALGLTFEADDNNLAMALGGLSKGESPLQMADAYQVYATGGLRIPAHMIRKVVDSSGNEIYSHNAQLTQVISEKTANYMKYMLRSVVTNGTGTAANTFPDQMVVGKTGTTEFGDSGANKDIWFVGLTKDYVGAIWMGFDRTDDNHNLWDASYVTAGMFGKIIKPLLAIHPDPVKNYVAPSIVKPGIRTFKLNNTFDETLKKVVFTWEAAGDTYYKVYRDDSEVEKTEGNTYTDQAFEAGKTYAFKVSAFNKFTNFQTQESEIVTITVQMDTPTPVKLNDPNTTAPPATIDPNKIPTDPNATAPVSSPDPNQTETAKPKTNTVEITIPKT